MRIIEVVETDIDQLLVVLETDDAISLQANGVDVAVILSLGA